MAAGFRGRGTAAPRRAWMRRPVAATLALAALTASACSDSDGGSGQGASPAPTPLSASVRAPADATSVLDAGTPEELAVAVSQALFAAAPAVIVAAAGDAAALEEAAGHAGRLGIPLLLDAAAQAPLDAAVEASPSSPSPAATAAAESAASPAPDATPAASGAPDDASSGEVTCASADFGSPSSASSPTGTASPTPSASASAVPSPSPSASATASPEASAGAPIAADTASPTPSADVPTAPPAAASAALLDEIRRLAPTAVLAMTPAVAGSLAAAGLDAPVVGDAADLPATTPADGLAELTVLVPAGDDPAAGAGAAAAAATASAAGSRVIAVRDSDPRADGCVVDALAEDPATQVLAVGAGFGQVEQLTERLTAASTGVQLPGGGQRLFPGRRLIALYGYPGAPELGVLGAQDVSASIERAKQVAAQYDSVSDVPAIPTFEIIATVAQGTPGSDGDYSAESAVDKLRPWVEQAGAAGMYVLLDLQPGRENVLAQAKIYEELLALPYVGLAVDPEWKLTAGQVPLQQIGGIDAAEVNEVAAWLAELTAANELPQKLLVVHQFTLSMIRDRASLDTSHDELAVLIHMDGQGQPADKDATWRAVTATMPEEIWLGWKNFYVKDTRVLSPAETLDHEPSPVMISYQ